ncbi:hypothetical protein Drorol1_Dr00008023 [Drosera rotundifolia]
MALAIGKLTLLVGAGLFGAVLAKEGRMPSFSDVVSGAFKVALKPIKGKDSSSSGSKPKNDALVAQVNSLRQELQLLASSRPVTIVTSSTTGGRRYGVIILIVVVGYGYVWWKGWKLPDLSFATKRSLSDATTSIAKQLEQVYTSISATRHNLSSRIDRVDSGISGVAEQTNSIKQEVTELCEQMRSLDVNIKSFHEAVQILATKIHSIHGNEEETNKRVLKLVGIVKNLETGRRAEQLQVSSSVASRPALGHAPLAPFSRTVSVPPVLSLEPPSPSASSFIGSNEAQQWVSTANSSVGLKDLEEKGETRAVAGIPKITNGNLVLGDSNSSSSSGPFGWRFFPGNVSVLSRTRSATQSFK